MSEVACYGVEYFDTDGEVCPFVECIAREGCKAICESTQGILHEREIRIKALEVSRANIKKEYKKKDKIKRQNKVLKIRKGVERKTGYTKPRRLEYKNEGCLRDEMMDLITSFFVDTPYSMQTTRYIQSVSDNFKGPICTKYLLKISTTRKKSILVYVDDELADRVDTKLFNCRQVYEYEKLCFPNYLEWVVIVDSMSKLKIFLDYLEV